MLLAIGVDGADSPSGGCTTHLASFILLEARAEGLRPADYPWLVRLNPSIPHKTRGNGALVVWLKVDSEDEARSLVKRVESMVEEYAEATGSRSKAGIVSILYPDSNAPPPGDTSLEQLYYIALRGVTTRRVALEHLEATRGVIIDATGGNGVIGAAAAIGARLDIDHTFELLFYMPPGLWGGRPLLPAALVKYIDFTLRPYGLPNYDYVNDKPLIQPHGPDPVLAGIRAEEPHPLRLAARLVPHEYYTHAVLYRTNQHTGVHIRDAMISNVKPYDCVRICGYVESVRDQPGGHRIARICDEEACIDAAFYRELGKLTKKAESLEGLNACVEGCARIHRGRLTLNVERVILEDATLARIARIAPTCPICGRRMKKVSSTSYACKHCGVEVRGVTALVELRPSRRVLEPDPSAWHHLYMPYVRALRIIRPRGLAPAREWGEILLTR